jgi:hypothetical protein
MARLVCWIVSADGNVNSEDLYAWFWEHDLDVNSAGIILGGTNAPDLDRMPALLFPDGQLLVLSGSNFGSDSARLNNPNQDGVFQVVGTVYRFGDQQLGDDLRLGQGWQTPELPEPRFPADSQSAMRLSIPLSTKLPWRTVR